MADYQTYIRKDRYKRWGASTIVPLDGRQLEISTYKSERAGLVTYGSVGIVERGFVTHKVFDDYSVRFASSDVRCTEKAVREQHAGVVANLPSIIEEITTFYADKDAAKAMKAALSSDAA